MYRNVFVLVILALSAASLALDTPLPEATDDPMTVKCANEVGVTLEFMKTEMRNVSESDLNKRTVKCVVLCLWKGLGLVGEDGSMNMTVIRPALLNVPSTAVSMEDVVQAFAECSKQKGEDPCDTVSKSIICLYHQQAFRKFNPPGVRF